MKMDHIALSSLEGEPILNSKSVLLMHLKAMVSFNDSRCSALLCMCICGLSIRI